MRLPHACVISSEMKGCSFIWLQDPHIRFLKLCSQSMCDSGWFRRQDFANRVAAGIRKKVVVTLCPGRDILCAPNLAMTPTLVGSDTDIRSDIAEAFRGATPGFDLGTGIRVYNYCETRRILPSRLRLTTNCSRSAASTIMAAPRRHATARRTKASTLAWREEPRWASNAACAAKLCCVRWHSPVLHCTIAAVKLRGFDVMPFFKRRTLPLVRIRQ